MENELCFSDSYEAGVLGTVYGPVHESCKDQRIQLLEFQLKLYVHAYISDVIIHLFDQNKADIILVVCYIR